MDHNGPALAPKILAPEKSPGIKFCNGIYYKIYFFVFGYRADFLNCLIFFYQKNENKMTEK
jgi:hypothetical protein